MAKTLSESAENLLEGSEALAFAPSRKSQWYKLSNRAAFVSVVALLVYNAVFLTIQTLSTTSATFSTYCGYKDI